MRRVTLMTLAVFVVSILAGSVVLAGEYHGRNHHQYKMNGDDCETYRYRYMKYKRKYYHDKKKRSDQMLEEYWEKVNQLDLSGEQMNQLYDLKFEWKLDKIDLKAAIDRAKVELHRLKYQDDVTRKEREQHIDEIYDAKAAYKKAMYDFKSDVNDQLTQEQVDRIKAMMKAEHKERNDRKHGDK